MMQVLENVYHENSRGELIGDCASNIGLFQIKHIVGPEAGRHQCLIEIQGYRPPLWRELDMNVLSRRENEISTCIKIEWEMRLRSYSKYRFDRGRGRGSTTEQAFCV